MPFHSRYANVVRRGLQLGRLVVFAPLIAACGSDDEPKSDNGQKNIEIVRTVLDEGVAGSDTAVINSYVREDYIQHGSLAPGGRAGLLAFAVLAEKVQMEVHRTLADGDLVALHSTYTFPDETQSAVFDVFRLEGGQLAEHWDAVQPLSPEPNLSGRTMTDGETAVADLGKTEQNRTLVKEFVQAVLGDDDLERIDEFVASDGLAQHDPAMIDGIEGMREFATERAGQGATLHVTSSPVVVAQGNFVLVGSEGNIGAAGDSEYAISYDLFRVSAGAIVEHWDVVPIMPNPELLPHGNGYF